MPGDALPDTLRTSAVHELLQQAVEILDAHDRTTGYCIKCLKDGISRSQAYPVYALRGPSAVF